MPRPKQSKLKIHRCRIRRKRLRLPSIIVGFPSCGRITLYPQLRLGAGPPWKKGLATINRERRRSG